MKGFKSKNQHGFTIIEVVLVLAIAGLIFLVVFLALPALQKSQRDNARKQDVARVMAGLQQYATDNNRQMPTAGSGGFGYISNLAIAKTIYVRSEGCLAVPPYGSTGGIYNAYIIISPGCTCSQLGSNVAGASNPHFANVGISLENGGIYCQDVAF